MFLPYLFLTISGFSLTAMSLLRKEFDRRMRGISSSFLFVAVSHAIVAVCCLAFLFAQGSIRELASLDRVTFLLGGSFGVINFVCTVICIVGATYGSTTLLVSFANLGIVTLSTVYGLIFDPARNQLSVFVLLGLLTAVSVIVIHLFEREKGEKRETTTKGKWIYKLLCVSLFFINGLALVIYSLQTTHRPAVSSFSFIAVYSVVSALFALIAMLPTLFKAHAKKEKAFPGLSPAVLLVLVGYALFFLLGEALSLANTTMIPIIIQAPLSFAIPAIILTTSEALIYKTPVTKRMIVELVLSLACTLLFVL